MISDGINKLWPTEVLKDKITDQTLLDLVINELYVTYNLMKPPSDINQDNIFDSDSETMHRFKNEIVMPAIGRYLKEVFDINIEEFPHSFIRGWVAGYSPGYFMINHNHSGSQITGVFYLLVEEGRGGDITFEDPRVNANRGYTKEMMSKFKSVDYQPKSGEFIIFPSYLYHYVTPFQGKARLAVPIDFNLSTSD